MKIDSKGNLILGTTVILITTLLLIAIFVFTTLNYIENENIDSGENDNFKYIVDDYSNNLEVLGRDSIEDACNKVYKTFKLLNSEDQIKKNLNKKLTKKNEEFEEKYDMKISSEVLSVEPTDSPWKVLFKVKLNMKKNSNRFYKIIEKNVSVEGLRDPLPVAKLSVASGIFIEGDKINYKNALTRYLKLRNLDSPFSYAFATSPLTIKKCPYETEAVTYAGWKAREHARIMDLKCLFRPIRHLRTTRFHAPTMWFSMTIIPERKSTSLTLTA